MKVKNIHVLFVHMLNAWKIIAVLGEFANVSHDLIMIQNNNVNKSYSPSDKIHPDVFHLPNHTSNVRFRHGARKLISVSNSSLNSRVIQYSRSTSKYPDDVFIEYLPKIITNSPKKNNEEIKYRRHLRKRHEKSPEISRNFQLISSTEINSHRKPVDQIKIDYSNKSSLETTSRKFRNNSSIIRHQKHRHLSLASRFESHSDPKNNGFTWINSEPYTIGYSRDRKVKKPGQLLQQERFILSLSENIDKQKYAFNDAREVVYQYFSDIPHTTKKPEDVNNSLNDLLNHSNDMNGNDMNSLNLLDEYEDMDVVTRFLRIVEAQQAQGKNCSKGDQLYCFTVLLY